MTDANRIMIIGASGSGKSTLARRLHKILDLPLIYLDQHYWSPGWVETDKPAWTSITDQLITQDRWVMDGNYGSTMDARIQRADAIIFLDYSTLNCLSRITSRILKHWRKTRPDMTDNCPERFDLQFYHYVATYRITRRPGILRKLEAARSQGKTVVMLKNDRENEGFLKKIKG